MVILGKKFFFEFSLSSWKVSKIIGHKDTRTQPVLAASQYTVVALTHLLFEAETQLCV
jgi:hypothetical protein